MPIIGPIINFVLGTIESTFFNLPMEGALNITYMFLNFTLLILASLGGIFGMFGG